MPITKRLLAAAALTGLTALPAAADVVTTPATLRSGPGIQHAALASLPRGALLQSSTCRAGWCRVEWRDQKGYLPSSVVAATGPGAAQAGPWPRRGYGDSRYSEYWEGRFTDNQYRPSHGVWASDNILD